MREAHVVWFPSYRDGLPMALLAAAATGRAIVATDVPSCRDTVNDGVNGLLVPTRNAAALEDALEKLIQDPALRAEMRARGRQPPVAQCSIDAVADASLAVYAKRLRAARSPACGS